MHVNRINEIRGEQNGDLLDRYPYLAPDREDGQYNKYLRMYTDLLRRGKKKAMPKPDVSFEMEHIAENLKPKRISIPTHILVMFFTMTDENLHHEVRYEIARYLSKWSEDMRQFEDYFGNYLENAERRGTPKDACPYLVMTSMMMATIAKVFGEDTADKIYTCL